MKKNLIITFVINIIMFVFFLCTSLYIMNEQQSNCIDNMLSLVKILEEQQKEIKSLQEDYNNCMIEQQKMLEQLESLPQ